MISITKTNGPRPALDVASNGLHTIPGFEFIDWADATLDITDISRVERQVNNQGLILYLKNGKSYTFLYTSIIQIGTEYTNNHPTEAGNATITNELQAQEAIKKLIGWTV